MPREPNNFVAYFKEKEPLYYNLLRDNVIIKEITTQHIRLEQKLALPHSFKEKLSLKITELFQYKLNVILDSGFASQSNSLAEQEEQLKEENINSFKNSPEFKKITAVFPEAKIINSQTL